MVIQTSDMCGGLGLGFSPNIPRISADRESCEQAEIPVLSK